MLASVRIGVEVANRNRLAELGCVAWIEKALAASCCRASETTNLIAPSVDYGREGIGPEHGCRNLPVWKWAMFHAAEDTSQGRTVAGGRGANYSAPHNRVVYRKTKLYDGTGSREAPVLTGGRLAFPSPVFT